VTLRELRRDMRERRRALREAMAQRRAEARRRVAGHPSVRRARSRRRIRRGALVACALLLALLTRCQCEPPAAPEPSPQGQAASPPAVAPRAPAAAPKAKRRALQGEVASQPRGAFGLGARDRPSWLEDFHLQVSARSGRLARCFTGTDRPGALRWAAALNAKSGAVSDHELEPLGPPTSFTRAQRDCVVDVLSNPGYRLELPSAEALPNRVGLVIEF
jgi:hypothetical protein